MFHPLLLLGVFSLGVCLPRQYHFINKRKTWAEAQKHCRENYVDLATIDNAEEDLAVADITYVWKSSRTWIGLYDDLSNWKWSLEDDSFYKEGDRGFRNWFVEKPRNWSGISLCVYLSDHDGVWRETSCSAMLPFICFDGRVNANERYVPVYQNMNWTEAQRHCRQHHTDLASVRNESENQKIRSIILNNMYYSTFWIGLYRSKFWSDKSTSSFSNWKLEQRDNYRLNESCTAVSVNDSGKWTDENCGQAFPFLCYSTTPSTPSHQYRFVNEKKTWIEAQRYCRETYTDLATIDNVEEMNTLLNVVTDGYLGLAWIGLFGEIDNWTWSLDDDAFYQEEERDFRGWEHQPDNYNGQELCVYVYSDGMWFDGDCKRYLPFVCYDGKNGRGNYTLINQPMPWRIAQHYCREHYTDLASVRSSTDNDNIFNLLGGSFAWIGLYRARIWSDKQESTYENWRPANPKQPDNGLYNHLEYLNQHCTAVSFRDSGYWTDEDCLDTLPFICYNRHCSGYLCTKLQYHFVNKNKTWTEAQRYCRQKYTDLATIHNLKEMKKLLNTVDGIYSDLAWIGLYDDLNSWNWSLGYKFFYKDGERNFRNWYIHKPLNWDENNLCVYIAVYGGVWWEESCSTNLPFICFDGRVNGSEKHVLVYQHMNWIDAQKYCREHYTDLSSVRNETENQKIKSLLSDMNTKNYYYYDHNHYHHHYYGFWLGLHRTSSWSDESNTSFSNWKPGQPDHSERTESCVAVSFKDDYYYGKWTVENCGQAFPFVCYSTLSSTSTPFHQYHFVNENKAWTEAQRYCREKYTDLATIDNMEEMNTFLRTVKESYLGLAWIGLYNGLDRWRWSLEDDAFYQDGERAFRGWYHQPDNYNGNEMCVSMGYQGEWFDWPCTERKSFVCYNSKNNYVWIYKQMTWKEAQSFCRVNYIDLTSVRNKNELQQILSITNGHEVWIGLYRHRLWSDKSESAFTFWRPSYPEPTPEPDNGVYSAGQHGSQHCTAVDLYGQWTDENCFASLPFICYNSAVNAMPGKITTKKRLLNSPNKGLVLKEFQQENRLKYSTNNTECEKHL